MLTTKDHIAVEKLLESVEQMAFTAADPLEQAPAAPAESMLISIDFSGPLEGRLDLLADINIGMTLAAGILGVDATGPAAREGAIDALKELLNVTCGGVLSAWPGLAAGTARMAIPAAARIESQKWSDLLAGGDFTPLSLDGYPMAIRLTERNTK